MLCLVFKRLVAIPLSVLLLGCSSQGTSASQASASASGSASVAPTPGLSLPELKADPREVVLAHGVAATLSQKHLLARSLDDEVSQKAFAEFLESLDGSKLWLLASHVEELETYATRLDDDLRLGNLRFARQAGGLLRARKQAMGKVVADLLAKPFDFSVEEEIETDPEKLKFSKTEEELRDRWRKVLKLQVLERVGRMASLAEALEKGEKSDDPEADERRKKEAAKVPPTFEEREKKAREEIATSFEARFKRWEDEDSLAPAARFINAVTSVYDPHTNYLPPATKENFDIEVSGSLEGIGAALTVKDHFVLVSELVPGGASWQQGKLEAGDLILAVAQEGKPPVDVTDMPLSKVVKMIRGPKGTVVSLTVRKPDNSVEVISITRDVVKIEASFARGAVLDNGKGETVGYINLPSFYGNTRSNPGAEEGRNATDDVRALLLELDKRGVAGVILDLRGNGGGLLNHARDISGLFIPQGPVVQARASGGELNVYTDDDPSVAFKGDVIVLVDRYSASASEIVAGALQDYDRALVVGTGPTHGKGTVQVLLDLDRFRDKPGPPLGVLKLTTQQYFRVDGESTQSRGVVPDIVLPDPSAHVETGERYLDNAIPWSEVEALTYKPWTLGTWSRKALVASSKKRVAEQPAFAKLEARARLLQKRRDRTKVPLSRKKWEEQRAADEKAIEAVALKLDEGPTRFKVEEVSYGPKAPGADDERIQKRLERWRESLARDPWVEEALHLVREMHTKP